MTEYTRGVPVAELKPRIQAFQALLHKRGVDAAIIVQKSDFFYLTGTNQQGWLYVPREGQPLLMIFKEFVRAKAESALERIVDLVSPKKIPGVLETLGYPKPKILGMELDVLPTNLFFQYRSIFDTARIVDISIDIRMLRAVKSPYEIAMIRRAAALSDKLAARVPELLEPGKTEITLAGELEAYARSLGHQGLVKMRLWGSELFYGHLLSGPSGGVPSYLASPTGGSGTSPATGQGAGHRRLGRNEPILVDYVFALDGYLSDHARIFSIGKLPDDMLKAHNAMLEVQDVAKCRGIPGIQAGELYEIMVAAAADRGYAANFMGVGDRRIRFTGHGIGLELDEFPFIAKGQTLILEPNMVIAMEPKVVLPGRGVVGIENSLVVTPSGLESLSSIQEDVVVV
ncbi:PepP [Desulforapulum autotrophicum HRM2]|uniref:PepP n=1 Tax=Desulforapulum autotrophicum (strain ATCC 43914 / DSM 3382 / VKM B-1955 / HRM2) TaxID=177437 RepID=C0QL32_DESAH|nr:Xaa-Pro peptidase family protein [Desulforapulum autotrophicum]ACN14118.1 PepP [Desulforapulum autotrophicum HRM2]